jgi:predicted GIY-YIG superfamily endonuclease
MNMDRALVEGLFTASQPCIQSGVYVLWRGAGVAYVGCSRHVHLRVGEHTRDRNPAYATRRGIDFDRWTFVPCKESEMFELERSYIDLLKPLHNKRS